MTSPTPGARWLVLGATGAVGRFLLPALANAQPPVTTIALSRGDAPPWTAALDRVQWRRGDIFRDSVPEDFDTVLSAGPLDGLLAWLERGQPRLARIVALSSTSVHAKKDSPDASERALSARLADCEARLAAWSGTHAVRWTVLRPTLIYGAGSDRSLSAVARSATQLGMFALPRSASGLRQPVHAADVAQALLAAVDAQAAYDRAYDLPGGETLDYHEMIARVLACLPLRPRLVLLPDLLFAASAAIARMLPAFRGASGAVIARMREDLVFDAGPAARDFGYAPRAFAPNAAMFGM